MIVVHVRLLQILVRRRTMVPIDQAAAPALMRMMSTTHVIPHQMLLLLLLLLLLMVVVMLMLLLLRVGLLLMLLVSIEALVGRVAPDVTDVVPGAHLLKIQVARNGY